MITDFNYMIHDWMYKELKLRNGQVLAFAYLYAISRAYRIPTMMQAKEVAAHTGMTERNARNVLNTLTDLGYIYQKKVRENGLKHVYWTDSNVIINLVLKKKTKK